MFACTIVLDQELISDGDWIFQIVPDGILGTILKQWLIINGNLHVRIQ